MWMNMIIWMAWFLHCSALTEAQECRQLKYSQPVEDRALTSHVIININTTREDICNIRCFIEPNCLSFNVGPLDEHRYLCEISDSDEVLNPEDLVQRMGFTYQGTESPCSNDACVQNSTCQAGYTSKGYRCICPTGFTGSSCSQDIDECTNGGHDCPVNADCVNTEGSFNCTCSLGYTGDGRHCTAVNDCTDAPQTTGVYNILNHGLSSFPVYCDQTNDGGGWTMIFKVVGGASPPDVGQLWASSNTHSENIIHALDTTTAYNGHYKNRVVMNWQTFQPQQVRVVLYKNGVEVVALKFNAVGTNNLDWFSQANLISSPWNDLKNAPFVHFGIIGPQVSDRYFEFLRWYTHCSTDTGWLLVSSHPVCLWDKRTPQPSIQYSKLATASFMADYVNVGIADVLAVFVR